MNFPRNLCTKCNEARQINWLTGPLVIPFSFIICECQHASLLSNTSVGHDCQGPGYWVFMHQEASFLGKLLVVCPMNAIPQQPFFFCFFLLQKTNKQTKKKHTHTHTYTLCQSISFVYSSM